MRPRSAGEIFDRGFGILVRSAGPAAGLLAIVVLAIGSATGLVVVVPGDYAKVAVGVVGVLAAFFPTLWSAAGIVYLYGSMAADRPCTFREALRNGRRRSLSFFGSLILGYFVAAGAFIPAILLILGIVAAVSIPMPTALAVTVGAVTGIPTAVFCVALYGVATCAVNVSLIATVYEGRNPAEALASALFRTCRRSQLRRAIAVGIAALVPVFAIEFGFTLLSGWLIVGQSDSKAEMIFFGVITAGRLAAQMFGTLVGLAWCAVFSLDARIRLEGLDLALALHRAESPAPAG